MSALQIAVKSIALAVLLVGLQCATAPLSFKLFAPARIHAAHDLATRMPDLLYFGDSTINPRSVGDRRTTSTAVELARELPACTVDEFGDAGYSLLHYAAYLQLFLRRHAAPECLIVPINLRSFSPTWDRNPAMQLERERLFASRDSLLFRAWFKPMAVFGVLPMAPVSHEEFQKTPYFDGTTRIGVMADLPSLAKVPADPEIIARTIRAMYAGAIPRDHRLLDALRDVIRMCRTGGVSLLLYITPVDYAAGDHFLDGEFSELLRTHARLVEDVASEEGAKVLDFTRLFGSDLFRTGAYYADEHLTEEGRRRLAAALAEAVRMRCTSCRGSDAL